MSFQTQALYFDGQTSVPHKTELFLDNIARELKFTTDDGSVIYHSIYDIDYEIHNDKMRIRFKNNEIHIVIDDENFIREMDDIFNLKVKTSIYKKLLNLKFRTYLLLTLAALPLIAVLYISVTPIIAKKAVSLIPIVLDVKLGDMFMEKYIKTVKIDSAKTALLNEFASKIILGNKIKLNIYVVESNTINAFALPNGSIIIFTGLLNKIDDYETLAALLSHEISHINKRHSMQIMCKSLIGYALVSVLLTDISGLTAVILENAEMLTNLSYSRDMELEADNAGIALLEKNEINPDGMVKLMIGLQENSASNSDLLSTHPATETRIKNAESKSKGKYVQNPELELIFKLMRSSASRL